MFEVNTGQGGRQNGAPNGSVGPIGSWIVASALSLIGLLGTVTATHAQGDGGCVYDRRIYAEGTEMCQGGQRVRCENGAWGDIGMCDGNEPPPEPITSGGDRDERYRQ